MTGVVETVRGISRLIGFLFDAILQCECYGLHIILDLMMKIYADEMAGFVVHLNFMHGCATDSRKI